MDLDYLYFLQCTRESAPDWINILIYYISEFAGGALPTVIMGVIFWCVNRQLGAKMLVGFCSANAVNGLMKVTACVYRPWIRDPRLYVADCAKGTATGYSFPSGHSTSAGAIYTSWALAVKKYKKWLVAVFVFLMVATLFARNWLGAHTPQDVIAGCLVGVIMVFVMNAVLDKTQKYNNGDLYLMLVVIVIVIMGVLYTELKPYPLDLGADGIYLADPYAMQTDTIKGLGMLLGSVVGYVIQKHFVTFSTDKVTLKTKVLRAIVGIFVVLVFYIGIGSLLTGVGGDHIGGFLKRFLAYFSALVIAPYVFKLLKLDKK